MFVICAYVCLWSKWGGPSLAILVRQEDIVLKWFGSKQVLIMAVKTSECEAIGQQS